MQTAQEIEQLRKVLGDKFPADLEDILQKLANKPADSDSDVSASAKSVEVEPPAVELPAKLSEVDQYRYLLGSAPIDKSHHDFWLKVAEKFPQLQAAVAAHFSPLLKPEKPSSKKAGQLSKEQISINGIKQNLWHPGCTPPQSRISSSRFILNNTEWSEANRKWAEAEIARYEVSIVAQPLKDEPKSVLRPSIGHCKVDPAISRAASLAGNGVPIRAYWIARQHNTDKGDGSGKISGKELKELFVSRGLCKPTYFYQLLDMGEKAGFWVVEREYRSIKDVYLVGLKKMATLVLSGLDSDQLEDFKGNQAPGSRMIWVDCSGGSIQKFRGNQIGAWLEQRSEEGVKISNSRLGQMWGVTGRTIQNRRTRVGLTGTANYADGDASIAPAHAVEGENGMMKWQMVNTYVAPSETRRHSGVGQQSKVRKAVRNFMNKRGDNPAVESDVGEMLQRYFDGKTPQEAEKLARKAITKERADDIIFIYQGAKLFSEKRRTRSDHERYTATEAYSA